VYIVEIPPFRQPAHIMHNS